MYNLRVTVEKILGFCDSPMHVGDHFEVHGGKLILPPGQHICIWALQSLMPFFPAKQRVTPNSNDWIPYTDHFACPDPNGQVIYRIDLLDPQTNQVVKLVKETPKSYKRLVIDPDLCSGCRACEMACSVGHHQVFSSELSRIAVIKDEAQGIDLPSACHQCGAAPCIEACPVRALSKDPVTHAVIVDADLCTGCQRCAAVCVFDTIRFSKAAITPLICDLCNGSPACVAACATGALLYK